MDANALMEPHVQDQPARKNAFIDLRAPGLLAKRPWVGLILFIFGSLLFGGLAFNLRAHGPLLEWDNMIANTLPAIGNQSPAFLKPIMDAGFYIGKEVITVLVVLLALFFLFKRYWQELAMLIIGWAGTGLLFLTLTNFFARQRPPTQIWIIVKLPGFPSGHAISVVVFYGLLAYLLAPKMPSVFWKVVMVAAALFIIGFVGFSRIFTAGHYLTDILAGYAVGIAWAGAAYTLIEIISQKIRYRNVEKE